MVFVVTVLLVAGLVGTVVRVETTATVESEKITYVGAKGDKGDVGHLGRPGYRGLKGERGISGRQGPTGEKGQMGTRGVTGPPGLLGSSGVIGSPGKPGLQGPPGNTGLQGHVGRTGPRGIKGQKGSVGASGSLGPRGIAGADGQSGPPGHRGPPGKTGMKGEKGVTGEPGHKGERGFQGIAGPPIDAKTLKDYFEPVKTLQTEMAHVRMQLQKLLNGPAAHLSGSGTSWSSFSSGTTLTHWYTSSGSTWSPFLRGGMTFSNGILTVPQDGLYYVYTQLFFYHFSYPYAYFSIDINGSIRAFSYHRSNDVYQAYYMGRLLPLQKGDRISIVNRHGSNRLYLAFDKSFFGAFKLP